MKRTESSQPEKLVKVNGNAMRTPLSNKNREQLERLAAMPDSAIDFSDIPETSAMFRPVKLPIALRIDADLLGWLRLKPGYQTRINQILRDAMTMARREAKAQREVHPRTQK